MLSNITFEIFHIDTGNVHRNKSYDNTLKQMSGIPRLGSETLYLNTKDKADKFLKKTPKFKVNTVQDYCQIGETFPPNSGVIGCWASNYTAYKNFLNTDKDMLIIFEDDIYLSKNFRFILERYINQLPEDWEIFSPFVPDDSLFAYNQSRDDVGAEDICKSYQQWSTATYVINRAGAKRAIENIESSGITAPIDWYIFNFRMKQEDNQMRFNTYTIKPKAYKPVNLQIEAAGYSLIHNGNTEEFK